MGAPDMRLPIQLALTYPDAYAHPRLEPLDLLSCGPLTFSAPDTENFPVSGAGAGLRKSGRHGLRRAMNGANEEAVAMFLHDKIGFYDIYRAGKCRRAAGAVYRQTATLEQILEADRAGT